MQAIHDKIYVMKMLTFCLTFDRVNIYQDLVNKNFNIHIF